MSINSKYDHYVEYNWTFLPLQSTGQLEPSGNTTDLYSGGVQFKLGQNANYSEDSHGFPALP